MHRSIRSIVTAPILLFTASLLSMPARASDACQPVFDALNKLAVTPSRIYSTETAAYRAFGKPTDSETIYAGGAIYVKLHSKWIRSRMTPKGMLQQEQENRKSGSATCLRLPDELVGGSPASVFRTHEKSPDSNVDTKTWISKSTGLLLRQDVDIDVGGSLGKSHRSSRYEYGNVQPPQM